MIPAHLYIATLHMLFNLNFCAPMLLQGCYKVVTISVWEVSVMLYAACTLLSRRKLLIQQIFKQSRSLHLTW